MPVTVIKGGKPSFYVHNADLGSYGRVINPDVSDDVVDAAGWADSGHRFRPSLQSVTAQFRALFDDTSTASHAVIKDLLDNERVASVYVDGDGTASPGIGMGSSQARNYQILGNVGDIEEVACEIYQQGTWDTLRSYAALATYTASATGGTIDDGAANTSGLGFYVHVMSNSASGGNVRWIVEVHHSTSTTAASFATLSGASLTIPSGTTTGTVLSIASGTTVNRYTRLVVLRDASSGNIKVQAGVARR